MKNIKSINNWPLQTLYEITGSFFLAFFYFILLEFTLTDVVSFPLILGSVLFAILYFVLIIILSKNYSPHFIPLISFIELLRTEKSDGFLLRISGQFAGALLATLVHFFILKTSISVNLTLYAVPLHPLLTAIFTGFISQFVYFLIIALDRVNPTIVKYLLLSVVLGVIFGLASRLTSITILNPFGLILQYIFLGNPVSLPILIQGFLVHIFTPVIFVSGTHYFMKGFVYKK